MVESQRISPQEEKRSQCKKAKQILEMFIDFLGIEKKGKFEEKTAELR